MTIPDLLGLLGGTAGLAVLLVMALVPVLLSLPQPPAARAERPVAIPARRTTGPARHVHTTA